MTELKLRTCRRPILSSESELSGKVDRLEILVDHSIKEESGLECIDVDLKWETEVEDHLDCDIE